MEFIQIIQFILSISFLVILHELGHFLPAKWFKTKVEKFYLFFDPWFSIAKKKIGETEYGIGWLPFGGYVKIAGMVDESMDTEQLKKPAEPWEFRSKPAWQRLIIMLGGVTVNFFLAWIIFSCLSLFNGETYISSEKMKDGIAVSDAGKKMGFENGDIILKVDGKTQKDFQKQLTDIILSENITVLRNGKEVTFTTNEDGIAQLFQTEQPGAFIAPRIAPVVDSVASKEALAAGLKKDDKIINIAGEDVKYQDQLAPALKKHAGETINLKIERQGKIEELNVPISKDGKIGFAFSMKEFANFQKTDQYSLLQSIPRGLERSIESLTSQVKQFKLIFNSKVQGYKKVSGPIGIVKMMPKEIDWAHFWAFTAMFSVWLAFLNLIPIPGLDGGHVLFTLWEMITGKPVPQKVLENAQVIGVMFLLGLMVLIFGNDIYKLIIGKL